MTLWMIKTLHHWFGLVFAVPIVLISFSGTLLVFAPGPSPPSALHLGEPVQVSLDDAISGGLFNDIDTRFPYTHIRFPSEKSNLIEIKLPAEQTAYIEPTNFSIIETENRHVFIRALRRLHIDLFNPFSIGYAAVIWSGLIATNLAVFGITLLLFQRRSFKAAAILRPKSMKRADIRRTHISTGAIGMLALVFFGLSGWMIGEPLEARSVLGTQFRAPTPGAPRSALAALRSFQERHQGVPLSSVEFVELGDQRYISVKVRDASEPVYVIALARGQIICQPPKTCSGTGDAVLGAADQWHSGRHMPVLYKLFLIVGGLIMTFIAWTGFYSYAQKWHRVIEVKFRGRSRRP